VRTNGSLMVIREQKRINGPTCASIGPSLLVAGQAAGWIA